MAIPAVIRLCRPVFFVISLHATIISALQCYGCIIDRTMPAQLVQKDCFHDNPPAEFLINQTTARLLPTFQAAVEGILQGMIFGKIPMRTGQFCIRMSHEENASAFLLRYIASKAPVTSYLDESGCIDNDGTRICFCNQPKCNNGTYTPKATKPQPNNGTSFSAKNTAISFTPPTLFLLINNGFSRSGGHHVGCGRLTVSKNEKYLK